MRIVLVALLWMAGLLPPAQSDELTPGYWEQTPLPHTGLATFYAAGMMEYVLAVRAGHGQQLRCDECVGAVALLRAGDIGRKVWLQPPGGERVGPFLVIDCARREDIPPLLARNWAVDVSYELGQLWGMDRPLDGVTVLADPADQGQTGLLSGPLPAPTRFFVPPDKVTLSTPTPTPRVSPTPWRLTPWPTRLPAPLAQAPTAAPSTLAAMPLPAPVTPLITAPTPRVTASPTVGAPTLQPAAAAVDDVAVGRAGGGLLTADRTPAVAPGNSAAPTRSPTPSPTPSPSPTRTTIAPAATSPPILPRGPGSPPTPQPADGGGLIELLRLLLGIPRP